MSSKVFFKERDLILSLFIFSINRDIRRFKNFLRKPLRLKVLIVCSRNFRATLHVSVQTDATPLYQALSPQKESSPFKKKTLLPPLSLSSLILLASLLSEQHDYRLEVSGALLEFEVSNKKAHSFLSNLQM